MNTKRDQACRLFVFYALGAYLGACVTATVLVATRPIHPPALQPDSLSEWALVFFGSGFLANFTFAGAAALPALSRRFAMPRSEQRLLGLCVGAITTCPMILIPFGLTEQTASCIRGPSDPIPIEPSPAFILSATSLWSILVCVSVLAGYLHFKKQDLGHRNQPT